MDHLTVTQILSCRRTDLEAFSALPDAPVVPHVEPAARARRTRSATAAVLHRLGDVVAPPRHAHGSRSLG
jgi:hypothetical protein